MWFIKDKYFLLRISTENFLQNVPPNFTRTQSVKLSLNLVTNGVPGIRNLVTNDMSGIKERHHKENPNENLSSSHRRTGNIFVAGREHLS